VFGIVLVLLLSLLPGCSSGSDGGITKEEYTLTISVEGAGSVVPSAGTHTYHKGETVTLTAETEEGYIVEWKGASPIENNSFKAKVLMDKDRGVTVIFNKSHQEVVNSESELLEAINDESVNTIILGSDIKVSSDITLTRIADLNLNSKTLTANLSIGTSEAPIEGFGRLVISEGTIDGDLTVNAPEAEIDNKAAITGRTIIEDVSSNSFYNSGILSDVSIEDKTGCSFNNRPGSKVSSITIEADAINIIIENDGSTLEDITVKAEGTKVKNKNNTIIKGKVIIEGGDTELENEDSQINEVNVDAKNIKVRNNQNTEVTKVNVGESAKDTSIENSGSIEEVVVNDKVKDSTTVINEGNGDVTGSCDVEELKIIGRLEVERLIGESTPLPTLENEGKQIDWIEAYQLNSDGSREKIAGWEVPESKKVSRDQVGTVVYIGQISLNENVTKTLEFKLITLEGVSIPGLELEDGPAKVSNITATVSSRDVELVWTEVEDVVYYFVYRSNGTSYKTAKRVNVVDERSYQDKSLEKGTYYYWIEAYNSNGLASEISDRVEVNIN
jgi:hypothetical protein